MRRRDFVSRMTVAGLGAAAGAVADEAPPDPVRRLRRRPYGDTGRELSVVGMGGIVVMNLEQTEANDTVSWAVDQGVTYFDVAPSYGNAQERLGPALKPYRDRVFLACKTGQREAAAAQAELEESLRVLQTDHLDLYQLHGLTDVAEVDTVFAPGGAMETFTHARDKGQVLHLGFSAHSVEAALQAMDRFDFDSVLFPLNVVCLRNGGFGGQVLEKAQQKGVAFLALKALAWTPWPEGAERAYPNCWYEPISDRELARLALYYTLEHPIAAALPPGDPRLFRMAVELAQERRRLTDEGRQELLARVEGVTPIFPQAA